jgi:hypothetical protein
MIQISIVSQANPQEKDKVFSIHQSDTVLPTGRFNGVTDGNTG